MNSLPLLTLSFLTAAIPMQAGAPQTGEPAAILQSMPKEPASPSTPQQRAGLLPTLALLPADTETFICFPRVHQTLASLPLPEQLTAASGKNIPISITLSSNSGTASAFSHLETLFHIVKLQIMEHNLQANRKLSPKEKENAQADMEIALFNLVAKTFDHPFDPILIIVELQPEQLSQTKADLQEMANICRSLNDSDNEGCRWIDNRQYAGLAWAGLGANTDTLLQSTTDKNEASRQNNMFALFSIRKNFLFISICNNPDKDIRLAKSSEESFLATPKAAFLDAYPAQKTTSFSLPTGKSSNHCSTILPNLHTFHRQTSQEPYGRTKASTPCLLMAKNSIRRIRPTTKNPSSMQKATSRTTEQTQPPA